MSAGCSSVRVKSMIFVAVKLGQLSGWLFGRFDWSFWFCWYEMLSGSISFSFRSHHWMLGSGWFFTAELGCLWELEVDAVTQLKPSYSTTIDS